MRKQKRQHKPKEIVCTEYRLDYRPKKDPGMWFTKCFCETLPEIEKYKQILIDVSDMYLELRIVPVTVHKMI